MLFFELVPVLDYFLELVQECVLENQTVDLLLVLLLVLSLVSL